MNFNMATTTKTMALCFFFFMTKCAFTQELDKRQIHKLTKEIIQTIDKHYIIPNIKDKIVKTIEANLANGRYDAIRLKRDFEKQINKDLKTISDDGHLYLVTKVETAASKSSPRRQMMRRMPDPSAFKDLLKYKILEGNIAYLEVPMFGPLEYLRQDLDKYLELSKSADALIIDVRNCPGGSAETMAYLAGGFIAKPALLTTYYSKDGATKLYSSKTNYGADNQQKPVYVLTSHRTGSAGEGFAFYLQQMGRVKVVGMQSAGAGRGNQFYPIGKDFSLSVSTRTSTTPNKKQFQGVGVKPDYITPTKNALEQAKILTYIDLQQEYPNKTDNYKQLISKIGKSKVRLQPGDIAKITNTVKGYVESFFENNVDEMYKHLHPDLAKRGMNKKRDENKLFFHIMTEDELRSLTTRKKALPKSEQENTIEILDVSYNSANVKLTTGYPKRMQWIEYIILCRIGDEWKITDIVWDYIPSKQQKPKRIKK